MMIGWPDEGLAIQILEIANTHAAGIPRRGGERRMSSPYPTSIMSTDLKSPEPTGWEVMVFDDDVPISLIEVAFRESSLRWVGTAGSSMAAAVTKAMVEAERFGATTTMEFGLVRVPQIGLSLLWLDSGAFIPVRVPHLRDVLPEVLSEGQVSETVARVLNP